MTSKPPKISRAPSNGMGFALAGERLGVTRRMRQGHDQAAARHLSTTTGVDDAA
jgi:hypothetical protein